jgi:hypothetical protein
MTRIVSVTSLLLLAAAQQTFATGPRVDIVIGEKAPALEKRVAEDIAADLKEVYDAEVKIATAAPEGAENVIFVGSPETNEQTKKQIAENWPKLSEHGHFVRTIKYRSKPALFIGGGSPRGAYWGAAEYAHQLGIRTMLYGDLYPVAPKPFTTEGFDIVLDNERGGLNSWFEYDPFPTGYTSWGNNDHKKLFRQLSRLKHYRVNFAFRAWQPFVRLEMDGVKKETGVLWYGWSFPVTGDTAGRAAFHGAKFFENPDFAGNVSVEGGQRLINALIDEANRLGMEAGIDISPTEFPKDFASVLPSAVPVDEPEVLAVRSGEKRKNPGSATESESVQLAAYSRAYPKIKGFMVMPGTTLKGGRYTPLVADLNFQYYYGSRWIFDATLTKENACRDLVVPICGEGVDGSVFKALQQIDDAKKLVDKNDELFSLPARDMILKHYVKADAPPEWWSKVRENYLGAMNDMYRANSRAREGGRSYTLYLARRCEFGYEYMNCVEATRKAGIAKSKKDTAEQRAQLEKAVESMNAACSALAAVARDQSDRGMIAVCNEFGYKALQKELEKLDGEEGK